LIHHGNAYLDHPINTSLRIATNSVTSSGLKFVATFDSSIT